MTFRGKVQNGVVVFDNGSPLPDGQLVNVEPVSETCRQTHAQQLGDLVGCVGEWPADMAENHDHYIHGTPLE